MSGAAETLARLLHLIPLATREGGARLDELADELGVDVGRILKDVELLTERSYYLPGGSADDLQISLDGDRLRIFSPGAFTRPLRLTSGELLAVAVALRCAGVDDAEAGRILEVVEEALSARHHDADADAPLPVAAPDLDADPEALRDVFGRAVLVRRTVRFGYLKPGADAPAVRRVEPWAVLHSEGDWYVAGRDPEQDGFRLFRLDRVLGAQLLETTFEPDPAWDASAVVRGGQVMLAADGREPAAVTVTYARSVAMWVRERWEGEEHEDGTYRVTHPVFDERWLVRHVMGFGGAARVE